MQDEASQSSLCSSRLVLYLKKLIRIQFKILLFLIFVGVDKMEVDEGKGTLTVTGNADPYEIIVRTRKAGKYADVVSIGAPPPPPKQEPPKKPGPDENKKKQEEKKTTEQKAQIHDPLTCPQCQRIVFVPVGYEEPSPSCSIM